MTANGGEFLTLVARDGRMDQWMTRYRNVYTKLLKWHDKYQDKKAHIKLLRRDSWLCIPNSKWLTTYNKYIYIYTWAFQLLKNISRFAQSRVSSNLWSYRAFPQKVRRGMSWLCFPSAWPSSQSSHQYFAFNLHIQVGFCLIARSQNYTNLPDSWICGRLRVFAGVLRIFAVVLRVILGAVMCIYMRWCSGYENGLVCPWDAGRVQAMFSHIQNVTCGDSVATRKQNQAN